MSKSQHDKEKSRENAQKPGKSVTPRSGAGAMSYRTGSPLARLRREFDRLFDDFLGGLGGLPGWPELRESSWGLDVDEQNDKIVVRAEAPGFEPDDFDIQVRDNQLVLCACQSEETQQDGGRQWHQQELYRSVPLPAGIDSEHVEAQYRNGILTVSLPKTEQSKGRRIEVKR
jgi:HSP20 family protein